MGISFSFIDVDTDPKPLDKINSLFFYFWDSNFVYHILPNFFNPVRALIWAYMVEEKLILTFLSLS